MGETTFRRQVEKERASNQEAPTEPLAASRRETEPSQEADGQPLPPLAGSLGEPCGGTDGADASSASGAAGLVAVCGGDLSSVS